MAIVISNVQNSARHALRQALYAPYEDNPDVEEADFEDFAAAVANVLVDEILKAVVNDAEVEVTVTNVTPGSGTATGTGGID